MLFSSPVMCLFFFFFFFFRTWHCMPCQIEFIYDESSRVLMDDVMKRVKCSCGHILFHWIIISRELTESSVLFISVDVSSLSHIYTRRTHKKINNTSSPLYLSLYVVPPTSISSFTSSMGAAYTYNKTKKCCVHGKWEGEEGALER